jgi:hypothetical protein
MNLHKTPVSSDATIGSERPSPVLIANPVFDSLRARVESDIAPPAIIAITSALAEDGREAASRGLASSLVATGYATLLLDTALGSRNLFSPAAGLKFDDIARQLAAPEPASGKLAFLTLSDALMQRTTSQRQVQSAFEILRTKFDYIVISTGLGVSNSFATSVINGAESVLVSVKLGRREQREDSVLSRNLAPLGPRFLGVIALDAATIKDPSTISAVPHVFSNASRSPPAPVETDLRRREIVGWPR